MEIPASTPFALALADCRPQVEWTKKLLQAIGELNDVAGNHARSHNAPAEREAWRL